MLDVARRRLPGVDLFQSDMAAMDLGRQFDVITCLFGSIGYLRTAARLQAALECFSSHLRPGGVVIIQPWLAKESWKPGTAHMTTYDGPDVKIAQLSFSSAWGDLSILEMQYLVAENGKGIAHFSDRHELALFDRDETLWMMRDVGFDARFEPVGLDDKRGLLIGVKKSEEASA